jgi:hypothetical protein
VDTAERWLLAGTDQVGRKCWPIVEQLVNGVAGGRSTADIAENERWSIC